jgi:hypothetical protein
MNDRQCDVLIIGGGVTGVAAAVAAARAGAKTMLLEIKPFVGGNAVTGLCLHNYISKNGRQHVFGIAQELVDRLIERGGAVGHIPYNSWVHSVTPVDGDHFRMLSTEMLAEAGVQVIYGAQVVGVDAENGKIKHVVAALKGGLCKIKAKAFVDSSGDADVAAFAGATFRKGDVVTGKMQPVSFLLNFHNVDTKKIAAAIAVSPPAMATRPDVEGEFPVYFNGTFSKWNDVVKKEGIFPNQDHIVFFNTVWPHRINVNTTAVFNIDALDPAAMGVATVQLVRQAEKIGKFLKKNVPGFENSYFSPSIFPGVRETRNIHGLYEITDQDCLNGQKFDDTVGQICFPVDIHDPDTGQAHFYQIGGDGAMDIPFRAMLPIGLSNTVVAGRCVSATHYAHGATRNMAPCLVMGQAAGTAAAMAAASNVALPALDVRKLQARLLADGVFLGDRYTSEVAEAALA